MLNSLANGLTKGTPTSCDVEHCVIEALIGAVEPLIMLLGFPSESAKFVAELALNFLEGGGLEIPECPEEKDK